MCPPCELTERIADKMGDLDDPIDGCGGISLDDFICALNQV